MRALQVAAWILHMTLPEASCRYAASSCYQSGQAARNLAQNKSGAKEPHAERLHAHSEACGPVHRNISMCMLPTACAVAPGSC